MQKFIVGKNDAEQRLDKYLTKKFPDMPSGILYKGVRKKRIKINGKRAEISTKLKEGDVLELYINDEFLVPKSEKADIYHLEPELNIIYEDENILLADKAPGVSVHADETDKTTTLITHIQAYLYLKGEYDPKNEATFTPSLCNRIDKNTGGIVIAAKNAKTLRVINQKIKDKELQKKYLCIAHGTIHPKEDIIYGYHIKNTKLNKVFIFDTPEDGARKIATKYKVLKEKNGLSLVEVELLTGRTHQIRAHFAHIGHPLAGDTKYGTNAQNAGLPYKHQALYSYKLKFVFSDKTHLDYLNGREFTVETVPFAKDF